MNFIFRLANVMVEIELNFWCEKDDNVVYKVLYMIFESIVIINPGPVFQLPKIKLLLEQCNQNESKYSHWGKGTIFNYMFYNK